MHSMSTIDYSTHSAFSAYSFQIEIWRLIQIQLNFQIEIRFLLLLGTFYY